MKIEFLEAAEIELDEAFKRYEAQQRNLGVQFLTEFDAAIRRISAYPKSYALLEKEVRRCLIKRFPYGVLYGIDAIVKKSVVCCIAITLVPKLDLGN